MSATTAFPVTSNLFPAEPEPGAPAGKRPIAVIGAGFSGTIATVQLLRRLPADQPVLLCERAADFATGIAYATGEAEHLLNVRAANMSALHDDPLHFQHWLAHQQAAGAAFGHVHETEAGQFVSRGLYGRYLRAILDDAMRQTAGHAQLRLLPDEVIDITPQPGGYVLLCASGQRLDVAGVVLAVGNLPPEEAADARICRNPWGEKSFRPLQGTKPVVIIGTGLTMVDLAITLRRRGFAGPIIAISRTALLPHRHAPAPAWPTPSFSLAEEASIPRLMARLRQEAQAAAAQGIGWRAVIDSMRPITARLWARLPPAERARFLRHARRVWDVHRHRMAPPHADLIDQMLQQGELEIRAGRVLGLAPTADGVVVRYKPRGGAEADIAAQRVIFALGLEHTARTRDRLLRNLLDSGLVRLDGHGMGIEVSDELTVMGASGAPAERLWALGPIVRGVFWESVAVPDIRVQAAHAAVSVVARLRADAPRWSFAI